MQPLSVKNLFRKDLYATENFHLSEKGSDFEFPDAINVSSIEGDVTVIKLEETVSSKASLSARATIICDRCLDNFDTVIPFSFELEYTLDRKGESADGLYVDKYGNIDLSEPVRDELILAIPTQNFCKVDCPGICPTCGHNLNHEPCQCIISEEITEGK